VRIFENSIFIMEKFTKLTNNFIKKIRHINIKCFYPLLSEIRSLQTKRYIYYNQEGIKTEQNSPAFNDTDKLWIDISDPSPQDLKSIAEEYGLDEDSLRLIAQKTKRPQIRMLDNHTFSILLDIRFKTIKQLLIEGVYIYVGKNWIITLHSSQVEIFSTIKDIIEKKNRKLLVLSINALYFTIIGEIISRYEQLLTSIEITIADFEQKSLFKKPSKSMLNYLDVVAKQSIVIRRHFWYTRDAINFLRHMQNQGNEIRYLQVAYDDIEQLIQLIESYGDTINSTRDLYIANISLQLNDTMRILTVFSAIILPLSLITGIYGMNGLDLSKLSDIPQGLIIVLVTMVLISILLLVFFKRKQWIFTKEDIYPNSNSRINSKD
jgi:magnesium transporter